MNTNSDKLEHIYNSLRERLRKFIMFRVKDAVAADDILHDIFLKIHNNIATLRDESKLESWIFQIARNAITDHIRMQKETVPDVEELPSETEEREATKQLAEGLHDMISTLPEPYREALTLTEFTGLSQKMLAERLGISVSGAKSRVQRARKMLREALLDCCHIEFDRFGQVIDFYAREFCACSDTCKI
jgi:RNA polymerase sigma-70 factor, ECF subfamily